MSRGSAKPSLKVSFEFSGGSDFSRVIPSVDASACKHEMDAVQDALDLMRQSGWEEIKLSYEGGSINLKNAPKTHVHSMVSQLRESHMSVVYDRHVDSRAGAVNLRQVKEGVPPEKIARDLTRLVGAMRQPLSIAFNGQVVIVELEDRLERVHGKVYAAKYGSITDRPPPY